MRLSLALSALALIPASLLAQSTTIPTGYDAKEGPNSVWGLLRYTPARQQAFFSPKATGWASSKMIKSLWVRPNGTSSSGKAFKCDIMVEVSSKGILSDPNQRNTDWSKNHGSDRKVFMKRKTYNIPAFTKPATPPHTWMVELKGDAPIVVTTKQICVDTRVYTPTTLVNGFWYVDAASMNQSSGTRGKYVRYGTPCNPTTFWNYAGGLDVGGRFETWGYTRNKGDIVVAWLGSKKLNVAVGNGCTLYTDLGILHPVPVTTKNTSTPANFDWGVLPASAKGLKLYSSMAALTPALKLRWSRGLDISIGDHKTTYDTFGIYAYASGSTTFDPDKDPARFWSSSGIIFDVR